MDYAEAAYFDGNHCQHMAARAEAMRLARKAEDARRAIAARPPRSNYR